MYKESDCLSLWGEAPPIWHREKYIVNKDIKSGRADHPLCHGGECFKKNQAYKLNWAHN